MSEPREPMDPPRWIDSPDAPDGAAELVRSLPRAPVLPTDVRGSVARTLARPTPRPSIVRLVGPAVMTALVLGGLVLWRATGETPEPQPLPPELDATLATLEQDTTPEQVGRELEALAMDGGAPPDAAEPRRAIRPRAAARPEPTAEPEPEPATEPEPEPAAEPEPERQPEPASEPGFGRLRIDTRPWSEVYIDDALAGRTPLSNLRLRAGVHRVRLVDPEHGVEHAITIDIVADQLTTRIVTLPPPDRAEPPREPLREPPPER